jgi:hypothetical protein
MINHTASRHDPWAMAPSTTPRRQGGRGLAVGYVDRRRPHVTGICQCSNRITNGFTCRSDGDARILSVEFLLISAMLLITYQRVQLTTASSSLINLSTEFNPLF